MEDREIITIGLIVAVLFIALSVFSGIGYGGYGMMRMMGGFNSGVFGIMTLFWILLLIALVLFIAWLIKELREDNRRVGRSNNKIIKGGK